MARHQSWFVAYLPLQKLIILPDELLKIIIKISTPLLATVLLTLSRISLTYLDENIPLHLVQILRQMKDTITHTVIV